METEVSRFPGVKGKIKRKKIDKTNVCYLAHSIKFILLVPNSLVFT